MTLSDDGRSDAIGALRLGFSLLIAPFWILGGVALVWIGHPLLGSSAIGLGVLMGVQGYRLYRAIERPDVVRDERTIEAQYRAGYNGFWTVVLIPSLYIGLHMFLPSQVTAQIVAWGGWEIVYPIGILLGLGVYFGSSTYYRHYGF